MDLDAFTAVHTPEWERLRTLSRQRRLDGAEADELVRLYQAVATHLSTVRSAAPDPALLTRLSDLLSTARVRVAGAHEPAWRDVMDFAVVSLPAAFYRLRWWIHGVTLACLAVAVIAGVYVATDADALNSIGTPSARERYVESAFAEYYDPGAGFAGMVWTNNAWIALQLVGGGITGIFPLYVLYNNAVQVGMTGGMMAAYGELDLFLTLISPHGLMELTAVFAAGAAGLRLFWTLVDPGHRRRSAALAQEGRALVTTGIGLAAALGVSGLVEGFVTGSTLPWGVKIAIGALVLAGFWTYVYVLGRRAVARGRTGDLAAHQAGEVAPVAG